MRKEVILFSIVVLVFILPFATAQVNSTIKNNAKNCILNQVKNKNCSSFGLDDKIFSLMSVGKCENELLSEAQGGECWGFGGCTIKTTSQAILALDESGKNTDDYFNWLSNQTKDATGLNWFIQVESPEASSCEIYDSDGNLHKISLDEDKKISSISGTNCLNIDSTGYWLEIKPSCYNQDFDVSCDKPFLTNLLFKESTSSTIYVLSDAQQSSAGGTNNINHVVSHCFKSGSSCDYEGTLWATLVLTKLGEDVSSYFPYLMAFEDDNENLLPESFLYILTNEEDFINNLISKQKREKYWEEKGGMYYDTALALLAFSGENEAKQNSIKWLTDEQRADGCWDSGSAMHTGFLIYSLWGSSSSGSSGGSGGGNTNATKNDCEDSKYFCLSDIQCLDSGGNELNNYDGCSGTQVCCDKDVPSQSCADLNGNLCDDATQICDGQENYLADDSDYSKTCCIGTCKPKPSPPEKDTCTLQGYSCKESCETGESSTYDYDCDDSSQSCCMPKSPTKFKWWIWLLIGLIVLVILAIIFKNKLKMASLKSKMQKRPGPPMSPRIATMPPPRMPVQRPMPARYPLQMKKPMPPAKGKGEMDDVLKKLKEMGK